MVISRQHADVRPPGPASEPSLPAAYLVAFLNPVHCPESLRRELLESAGLGRKRSANGPARLPLPRVLGALRRLDQELPSGWFIQPALSMSATQHGALGVAIVTAADVGSAIDVLTRYLPVNAPWLDLTAERNGRGLQLSLATRGEPDPMHSRLTDISLLTLVGLILRLTAAANPRIRIELPIQTAVLGRQLQAALPACHIRTGRSHRLDLPRGLIDQPCLLADRRMHRAMIERCHRDRLLSRHQPPLPERVHQCLAAASGPMTLAQTAAALHCSPRTLNRRLARAGTGFRRLLEQVRREQATELLDDRTLTIASIAERLGYSDSANFSRAFRRWYGISPGHFRVHGSPAPRRADAHQLARSSRQDDNQRELK